LALIVSSRPLPLMPAELKVAMTIPF
jgi:hypothetical protein